MSEDTKPKCPECTNLMEDDGECWRCPACGSSLDWHANYFQHYSRIRSLIDPGGEMTPEQVVGEVERVWERLPTTADGVGVSIGSEVWHPVHGRMIVAWGELRGCGGGDGFCAEGAVMEWGDPADEDYPGEAINDDVFGIPLGQCYSTKSAAASAAAEREGE